ncbi:ASCH domain-containing protein [Sphaerisporangium album]|uniref:ASCH domain-containing protein n=1 Tax=Sphaerisporangium album TaxID=509200 RepID=A0A367EM80_9ACTN|nr:ASCH domain-containing protein [Sphaerisporangium album]RCG19073.1 ASCH domain-containing protein [Sphaerisporangium album]
MRALSIQQPWAHLIASGVKDIENRTWKTAHLGLIAIHASKTADGDAVIRTEEGRALIADALARGAIRFGAIIAVTEITGCHRDCAAGTGMCSVWAVRGQWHWHLANTRALATPIPAAGRLGLWPLSEGIERQLRDQLAG